VLVGAGRISLVNIIAGIAALTLCSFRLAFVLTLFTFWPPAPLLRTKENSTSSVPWKIRKRAARLLNV